MLRNTSRSCRVGLGLAMPAIIWLAFSVAPATAQGINAGSFTLKVTEKEMKLEHPTDMMWDKYLMWDLPFQRVNNRNMPYLELTNDTESNAPLTEFHLTIGDTRFNFSDDALGEFAMLGSTTPNFSISSNTVGNLGNELVVKIGGGGLKPGELIRFKIDLDVDAAFADQIFDLPDYRTIFFDMNGLNVYDGNLQDIDTSDNAKASSIFTPTVGSAFTVGPVAFDDELVADRSAQFFNEHRRPYRESGFDTVRTFALEGGLVPVPEPGCALLAAMGMVGGLFFSRRTRRPAQRS